AEGAAHRRRLAPERAAVHLWPLHRQDGGAGGRGPGRGPGRREPGEQHLVPGAHPGLMRRLTALLPLLLASAPPSSGGGAPAAVHDLHVSHTRMVLEERTVVLRIRLFHDDLQLALQRFAGDSALQLTPERRADSLFGAYAARTLRLEADGRAVHLSVSA